MKLSDDDARGLQKMMEKIPLAAVPREAHPWFKAMKLKFKTYFGEQQNGNPRQQV